MNYTKITLGELLSHTNDIIKRNAMSILKQLQKNESKSGCLHNDWVDNTCVTCGTDLS